MLFGFQVNGPMKENLFSVWSPFKTDNPKEIPEDFKIKLLRKVKKYMPGVWK